MTDRQNRLILLVESRATAICQQTVPAKIGQRSSFAEQIERLDKAAHRFAITEPVQGVD
jgi:hypothetical protein